MYLECHKFSVIDMRRYFEFTIHFVPQLNLTIIRSVCVICEEEPIHLFPLFPYQLDSCEIKLHISESIRRSKCGNSDVYAPGSQVHKMC